MIIKTITQHHFLLAALLTLVCASAYPRQARSLALPPGRSVLQAPASEQSLKIVSVTKLNAEESVDCNANNEFPIGYKVVVQNNGTSTLTAGDDNYSLSIINSSNNDSVIITQPITQTLEAGATSDTILLSTLSSYKNISSSSSFYVKENITGTKVFGSWITPVPYEPRPYYYSEKGSYLKDSATIDFGMAGAPLSTSISIRNYGAQAFTVNQVSLPNGFALSAQADTISYPISIGAHETYVYPICFTASAPGYHEGMMTISTSAGDMHLHLTGTLTENGLYIVNFEDGQIPTNFVQEGTNWSVSTYPNYMGAIQNSSCVYEYSTQDNAKLITPLLDVAGGEQLLFQAAMTNTASHLKVYYSDDRRNWTLAKSITADATDEADRFTNQQTGSSWSSYYNFKTFSVSNIPAGNHYIAFEAGGVYLDNIYGYRLDSVSHDIAITDKLIPDSGMVNYPYKASVTYKNLNIKAENAYNVTLHFGEQAQEASTTSIAPGAEATYKFSVTPHQAGTYPAYITFEADGYSLSTDTVNVKVAAEQAFNIKQVGEAALASSEAPINLFYKKNLSEQLYTAAEIGLAPGTTVKGLQFKGFEKEKDLTGKLTIYVANTNDTEIGATLSDTTAMTRVYDNANYVVTKGGDGSTSNTSSNVTDPVSLIDVTFNEPFTYAGNSLRVVVKYDCDTYASGGWQATNTERAIIARSDNSWDTSYSTCNLPVIYLTYDKHATVFSGKVSDSEGNALADVNVTAAAGDVAYTTTTDAQGAYSLNILQDAKTYSISYTLKGYAPYKEQHNFTSGSYPKNITLQKANGFFIDETNLPGSGKVNSPYTATVKALNPETTDIPAFGYTATLYFDKQAVANANPVKVASGETAEYTFSFTPHEKASHKAYVVLKYGDKISSTDTVDVVIGEESFDKTLQIGDSTAYSKKAPVNTYDKKSEAIIVYPASLLGLHKGTIIKRLQYRGYVSGYNSDSIDVNLRVYMQNTDIEKFTQDKVTYGQTGADTTQMTKVYDGILVLKNRGSEANPESIIDIEIPDGFKYEGKSILLYFSNSADSYRSSYYVTDESKNGYVLTRSNDYELPETFTLADGYGMPVTLMQTSAAAEVTFNVKDSKGNYIDNAHITLKSGDVEYYGLTKDQSSCRVMVGRTDLSYKATVKAEGFEDATIQNISFADSLNPTVNVTLTEEPDTIITSQPAGEVVYYAENAHNLWQSNGNIGEDNLDHKIKMMVRTNDGYIYIKDFMDHLKAGSWIRGKVDGDTIRFKLPQPYYEMGGLYDHRLYGIRAFDQKKIEVNGMTYYTYVTDTTLTEMKFVVRGDSMVMANKDKFFGLSNETYGKAWSQFSMSNVVYYIHHDTPASMPADTKAEKWSFEYAVTDTTTTGYTVDAAIKDGNIYIKGLSRRFPDTVIKGNLQGNKAVFDSKQYLTADSTDMYYAYMMASRDSSYEVQMGQGVATAVTQQFIPSITFNYDATAKRLISENNITINHGIDSLLAYNVYERVNLNYFEGGCKTPAKPEWISFFKYSDSESSAVFNLYPKDVDGNFIDPDSLYYIIYNDDQAITLRASDYEGKLSEDITLIPYFSKAAYVDNNYHGITVYETGISRIGVQAVYRWNGEEEASDIVYYGETTGITANQAAKTVKRETYYDLSGRMVKLPGQGIFIKVTEYADGTKSTKKIVRK